MKRQRVGAPWCDYTPPLPPPPQTPPSSPSNLHSTNLVFFCPFFLLPLSPPPPPSPPRRRGYLSPTVQNRLDITVHQFQSLSYPPFFSPSNSPPHPEVVCIKSGPVKLQVEIGRPEPDSGGEREGGRRQLKAGKSRH